MNAVLGNRMSSLPIAQFCANGARLGQVAAGRAAAMSSAFHATASQAPDALARMQRLTDEEIGEVMSWKRPIPIVLEDGVILRYEDAVKELEVGLTKEGGYCLASDPRCISVGHLDMAWVFTINGRRVVYIGDIKRSSWTTTDGPDSLQLVAYAIAFAGLMKADFFACGIWAAIEGEWTWGDLVDLESERAIVLLDRVVSSILNDSTEYSTGSHCSGCYGRTRCPAYLLPPELAETMLGELTTGDITPEKALALKQILGRVEATAKVANDALKVYVERGGQIIDATTGKKWAPVQMPGRETFDKAAAAADGLDLAKYTKLGKGYSQYRWLKA